MSYFVLKIKLKPTKNQKQYLDDKFFHAGKAYIQAQKEFNRRINLLYQNNDYKTIMSHYKTAKKDEKKRLKELNKEYGLSQFDVIRYLRNYCKSNNKAPKTEVMSYLASGIVASLKSVIYKKGERIKINNQVNYLTSGANKEIKLKDEKLFFGKKEIKIDDSYKKNEYINRNLYWSEPKLLSIGRKLYKGNYIYSLYLTMNGTPFTGRFEVNGEVGIDIGVSTIAVYGDNGAFLTVLADNITSDDVKKSKLLKQMDRQRRINNPDNYNPDGTVKRDTRDFKKKWIQSKNYVKTKVKYQEICRKRAGKVKVHQCMVANEVLKLGNHVKVENMSFAGLAKKAKSLSINEKTGRYKSRKRFGKTISTFAPSGYINKINEKLKYWGREIEKINTFNTRFSQFSHDTGEYTKCDLGERWKQIEGKKVQRDLYSSYLISNYQNGKINIQKCFDGFGEYMERQGRILEELSKKKNIPSSIGIN